MDLNLAAALLAFDKLTSGVAIEAASSALDEGVYSKSLGLLFYEKPDSSEAVRLFAQTLSELSIPVPPRDEASLVLAREHARRIIAGEVSPYEGARRIWWDIANEQGADPSLRVFTGMASEWEDDPHHRPEYEAEIIAEARQLLGEHSQG
jgi:hypothetical protein